MLIADKCGRGNNIFIRLLLITIKRKHSHMAYSTKCGVQNVVLLLARKEVDYDIKKRKKKAKKKRWLIQSHHFVLATAWHPV